VLTSPPVQPIVCYCILDMRLCQLGYVTFYCETLNDLTCSFLVKQLRSFGLLETYLFQMHRMNHGLEKIWFGQILRILPCQPFTQFFMEMHPKSKIHIWKISS